LEVRYQNPPGPRGFLPFAVPHRQPEISHAGSPKRVFSGPGRVRVGAGADPSRSSRPCSTGKSTAGDRMTSGTRRISSPVPQGDSSAAGGAARSVLPDPSPGRRAPGRGRKRAARAACVSARRFPLSSRPQARLEGVPLARRLAGWSIADPRRSTDPADGSRTLAEVGDGNFARGRQASAGGQPAGRATVDAVDVHGVAVGEGVRERPASKRDRSVLVDDGDGRVARARDSEGRAPSADRS
jgi:hypothetical protein